MPRREPVSIVCVWNDEAVRSSCLDSSVATLLPTAPRTEYLPVDNRGQVHTTAGSALNSGVRLATHEYVAFIHQDVALHSLEALERAAGLLADDPVLGLLGAVGITSRGEIVGRIRDRVVLLGRSTPTPVDVHSVDEVLFLARRSTLLDQPISEESDLAWHAYAVEFGMRLRAQGLGVRVVDIPLTHNSMTTNLARLDHAHAALAARYPDQVPTRTTCGDITSTVPRSEILPLLAGHRWRLRWLRGSMAARRARAATGARNLVLADIRVDVDRVMAKAQASSLRVLNLVPHQMRFPDPETGTRLRRGGLEVVCRTVTRTRLGDIRRDARPTLVTNLDLNDLAQVTVGPEDFVGIHESSGYWLLTGVAADAREIWSSPRERPSSILT